MAVSVDFSLGRQEDGLLTVNMNPPTAIGGWNIVATIQERFGGISGKIVKSVASGFSASSGNDRSGISVLDSGQGRFRIQLNASETSGWDFKNYVFTVERRDSGSRTILSQGHLLLNPNTGV